MLEGESLLEAWSTHVAHLIFLISGPWRSSWYEVQGPAGNHAAMISSISVISSGIDYQPSAPDKTKIHSSGRALKVSSQEPGQSQTLVW